jgi:hypothetical protein
MDRTPLLEPTSNSLERRVRLSDCRKGDEEPTLASGLSLGEEDTEQVHRLGDALQRRA